MRESPLTVLLLLVLTHAVGESSRRRLIDYSKYFQSCDATSISSGLSLRIVKVSRDSDNGFRYFLSCRLNHELLDLSEYKRTDLFRAKLTI